MLETILHDDTLGYGHLAAQDGLGVWADGDGNLDVQYLTAMLSLVLGLSPCGM